MPNSAQDLGTYQVNTTGYGTYTSGGTMMKWAEQLTNAGELSPGSNLDVRVEATETVNGQVVLPRKGNYFLRSAIHFNKDHSVFSGSSGINKPRWNGTCPSLMEFDYDKEVWFGISHFHSHRLKTKPRAKVRKARTGLLDLSEDAGPSGGGFMILCVAVPGGLGNLEAFKERAIALDCEGEPFGHFDHRVRVTDSPGGSGHTGVTTWVVAPDKGKWTDFIIGRA